MANHVLAWRVKSERNGGGELRIRTVAAELGTKPMSLYNHIEGRDDLIDAILVRIVDEVDSPVMRGKQWRPFLRQAAAAYRTVLLRHALVVGLVLNEVPAVSPVAPTGIPDSAAAEFASTNFDATFAYAVSVFIEGLGR